MSYKLNEHAIALTNLGELLLEENKIEPAKRYFTKALLCDEKLMKAYEGLAECYCREYDFSAAIDILKKAYNISPVDTGIQDKLKSIQRKIGISQEDYM